MKQPLLALMLLVGTLVPLGSQAQQSRDFGNYVVHYTALSTNLLPPQVAQGYNIVRSPNRALLNVTVLKKDTDAPGTPVSAAVKASATNLSGQLREVDIREIRDNEGAIYYIGEFPVHNLETYRFDISVSVEGEPEPLKVHFEQQFFTE